MDKCEMKVMRSDFDTIDVDKRGFLELSELESLLKLQLGRQPLDSEVQSVLSWMGTTKDSNKLSFEEWVGWVYDMSCIVEDPSTLCAAALSVFKNATRDGSNPKGLIKGHERLGLGTCRKLGEFPTKEWKEDPRMPDFMKDHDYGICRYNVLEMTIIDGAGTPARLIGVINDGDEDNGFWGSVYLRPSFKEIGGLSTGDAESCWEINDAAWYVEHSRPLPQNKKLECGGPNAESQLETHLSHALAFAMYHDEEDDEYVRNLMMITQAILCCNCEGWNSPKHYLSIVLRF